MSTIPIKTITMKSSKTDIWQAFLSDEIISSFEIRTIITIRQNLLYFYWRIDSSVQPKHIVIGLVHTRVSLIKSNQYQSYSLSICHGLTKSIVNEQWVPMFFCKYEWVPNLAFRFLIIQGWETYDVCWWAQKQSI